MNPKTENALGGGGIQRGGHSETLTEETAVAIANLLTRLGHPDRGAKLLSRLIETQIDAVTINAVSTLSKIAYYTHGWDQASELWKLVVTEDPRLAEGYLRLAHALIELGDHDGAGAVVQGLRQRLLPGGETRMDGEVDAALEFIYRRLHFHYGEGDSTKCEALIKLCDVPGSYVEASLGHDEAREERLSDREISGRLSEAFENWRSLSAGLKEQKPPPVKHSPKVFLCFRQYVFGGASTRDLEVTVFIRESAQARGVRLDYFPAEPFLLTDRFSPDDQYRALDRFARALADSKPDIVIMDDLCTTERSAPYVGREVFRNLLSDLKRSLGFKLVAYYPDPWVDHAREGIEFASQFADIVWHQNVNLWKAGAGPRKARLFSGPIPYPKQTFRFADSGKRRGACFLGSVYSYNYLRAIWCTLIGARQVPCELLISTHFRGRCPAGDTVDAYAAFMGGVRTMVNFSARNPSTKIVTGRVWESILSKALLLEEANDEIKNFFVPFVHYVPFRSINELDAYIRFFETHEDWRRRIVEEAETWFQQRFSGDVIWDALFDATLGSPA